MLNAAMIDPHRGCLGRVLRPFSSPMTFYPDVDEWGLSWWDQTAILADPRGNPVHEHKLLTHWKNSHVIGGDRRHSVGFHSVEITS